MGRSSEDLIVSAEAMTTGNTGLTYGIYCRRSGTKLLCIVKVKSVRPFVRSIHPLVSCRTLFRTALLW